MSGEERSPDEKFESLEALRFYGIIRIKAEKRVKGADPKYTDKREFSEERGFVAGTMEELQSRAQETLTKILENQGNFIKGKEEKKEEDKEDETPAE